MAVKTLEETLAPLSADERKLFESTLSKHPEVKEGWLRQDDYSRRMNEFSAQKAEADKAIARAAELDAWAERNVPIWDGLVEKGLINDEGEEVWSVQKTQLEQERDEARAQALAGADMKPEELDKRVREIVSAAGGVTKAEHEALVQQEARKIAQEEFVTGWKSKETEFNEKTIPFVAGFSSATAIVASRFEKETGEKWDADRQKAMFKLMSDEKNFDPFAVEEKLMAPYREKKSVEERIEAEVQKRTATRRAETGSGDDYIPQEGEPKGALRQMLERSAEPQDFQTLVEQQARKAGAELRVAGKA